MRIIKLSLAFFVLGISVCGSLTGSPANTSLSTNSATDSLSKYQSVLASQHLESYSAPELWYHRGLEEAQSGNRVAASLSFRRALVLDPAFAPARKELDASLEGLGIPSGSTWQQQVVSKIHPDVLIVGGAILGWLGLLALVYLLMTTPRKPAMISVALVAFILGHGCSLMGTFLDPRRLADSEAVVTAKSAVTLRDTPADSATANGTLAPGSLISVLSRNGPWCKVSSGASTGWLLSSGVTPLLPGAGGA